MCAKTDLAGSGTDYLYAHLQGRVHAGHARQVGGFSGQVHAHSSKRVYVPNQRRLRRAKTTQTCAGLRGPGTAPLTSLKKKPHGETECLPAPTIAARSHCSATVKLFLTTSLLVP